MPIFRRRIRKTELYYEYFEIGAEKNLPYVDKDYDNNQVKKLSIKDGETMIEVIETWDEVKGPEALLVQPQLLRKREQD